MADSFVRVPADGVGKEIDTRTESTNGQHRQVVVLGDPSANAGIAPVDATAGLAVDPKTLPPGASTEATLAALNAKVTVIDTTSLATAAKQDTGNTALASLDTKILQQLALDFDTGAGTQAMPLVGIALPGAGGAVAGGTATNPLAVTGPLTDTQLRAADVKITLDGEAVVLGAGTAEIGNVKNAGTFAVQAAQATAANLNMTEASAAAIKTAVETIDNFISGARGLVTEDSAVATLAVLGATTGAAVVTDADGTIQRYLRGLVKLLITAGTIVLGAGTAVIGKIGYETVATATLANVASSASNVTLQASNASRKGWMVFNDSTAYLYVKFGATATTASFTVAVPPGSYFEMPAPIYTGIIDGIWASANGSARMTEL